MVQGVLDQVAKRPVERRPVAAHEAGIGGPDGDAVAGHSPRQLVQSHRLGGHVGGVLVRKAQQLVHQPAQPFGVFASSGRN